MDKRMTDDEMRRLLTDPKVRKGVIDGFIEMMLCFIIGIGAFIGMAQTVPLSDSFGGACAFFAIPIAVSIAFYCLDNVFRLTKPD